MRCYNPANAKDEIGRGELPANQNVWSGTELFCIEYVHFSLSMIVSDTISFGKRGIVFEEAGVYMLEATLNPSDGELVTGEHKFNIQAGTTSIQQI